MALEPPIGPPASEAEFVAAVDDRDRRWLADLCRRTLRQLAEDDARPRSRARELRESLARFDNPFPAWRNRRVEPNPNRSDSPEIPG